MAGSSHPDTQAGLEAFNRGDTETALRLWRKAAEAGDGNAMRHLAIEARDAGQTDEAIRLFQAAWDLGERRAYVQLGLFFYANGDVAAARKRWRAAAAADEPEAMYFLALVAEERGDEPDDIAFFEQASERGHRDASEHLAARAMQSRAPDDEQERRWRLAAEQGSFNACGVLASRAMAAERYEETLQWCDRALELPPESHVDDPVQLARIHGMKASALMVLGNFPEALLAMQTSRSIAIVPEVDQDRTIAELTAITTLENSGRNSSEMSELSGETSHLGRERMWPHLPEEEEDRRRALADQLFGVEDENLDGPARAVLSLYDIVYVDGDELYLYANAPDWPFGGRGASFWSWNLCDMKDIQPDGSWLEGEAAEMGTDRERFEALIETGDLNLWAIMAANPGCPGDLIDRMVRVDEMSYDHEQVRYCAAHNPATPPATLAWLIDRDYTPDEESESEDDDPDTEVRYVALRNPATPIEVLERWSHFQGDETRSWDDGWQDRANIAGNWAITPEIMHRLSRDEDSGVRASLARNPCTSVEILEMLSLDRDERGSVTKAVLNNPSSSERARVQASLSQP